MNSFDTPRVLRLEALESRCLLAGGDVGPALDCDGPDHDRRSFDTSSRSDRVGEASRHAPHDRPARPPRFSIPSGSPTAARPGMGLAPPPIANERTAPSGIKPNATSPTAASPLPTAEANVERNSPIAASIQRITFIVIPSSATSTPSPQQGTSPSTPRAASPPTAVRLVGSAPVNNAPVSEPVRPTTESAVTPVSEPPEVTPPSTILHERAAVPLSIADRSVSHRHAVDASVNQPTRSDASPLIEPLPPLADATQMNRSGEEAPWRLSEESVERLNELRASREATPTQSHSPHDVAMLDWFAGPGGLIELTPHALPRPDDVGFPSNVAIAFNATVGVHRSMDMIAAADNNDAGEAVRDAVLAALTSAERPAPLSDDSNTRISSLVTPGLLLLATTLAIARKRTAAPPVGAKTHQSSSRQVGRLRRARG